MVRLLFFVLIFILAPFAQAKANIDVQNCTVFSAQSNPQKTKGNVSVFISDTKSDLIVFIQADGDNDADTTNDKNASFPLFFKTNAWYEALWAARIKEQQKQDIFSSDSPVVLPFRYLLYHQLKIPFSTL